jgi:hypothetical protein
LGEGEELLLSENSKESLFVGLGRDLRVVPLYTSSSSEVNDRVVEVGVQDAA